MFMLVFQLFAMKDKINISVNQIYATKHRQFLYTEGKYECEFF